MAEKQTIDDDLGGDESMREEIEQHSQGEKIYKRNVGKSKPIVDPIDSDDEFENPMFQHFLGDVGPLTDDFAYAATGSSTVPFKEGRTKDTPCKFYDGVSEGCWKGKACVYGHKKYTGGVYAQEHPDIAFGAAASSVAISLVKDLERKPKLNSESVYEVRVTHVVTPSEFYVKMIGNDDCQCLCSKIGMWVKHFNEIQEQGNQTAEAKQGMDSYDYGFNAMELPQGMSDKPKDTAKRTTDFEDLLDAQLSTALAYRRFQADEYRLGIEIVAAKDELKWKRAMIIAELPRDRPHYRLQFLDTGEKITTSIKNVCRLPDRFLQYPARAFKCCLFGAAPVWNVWSNEAIQRFKELVVGKVVTLIVKEGIPRGSKSNRIFENRPYMVKLYVKAEDKIVDITHDLTTAGLGLEWHPFPYRPFITKVMDTKALDFFRKHVPSKLPEKALLVENIRLATFKEVHTWEYESDDEIYSSRASEKSLIQFKLNQI